MISNASQDATNIIKSTKLCENFSNGLTAGQVTFQDYAYNITRIMVDGPQDEWEQSIATIRPQSRELYLQYLHTEVELHDFMPHPRRFLFGTETHDQIKKIKKTLRPLYISLVEFAKKNLS